MRKYILTAAAVLGMVLALTACGNHTESEIANNPAGTADQGSSGFGELTVPDDLSGSNEVMIEPEADEPEPTDEDNHEPESESDNDSENEAKTGEQTGAQTEMKMNVQIGDYQFTATLENNTAVSELMDMLKEGPVTIQMDDYSGFEKIGTLGRNLTTSNSQTTTSAGDIVLYNGNHIVMFYGSNSWSYTGIGRIDDLSDWENALGSGSITAVFTLAE